MSNKKVAEARRIFRALSVETRRRILNLLTRRGLCVGALSNLVGISAGAVSQHLWVLREAGLVEAERRGQFVHYRVARDARKRCQYLVLSLFSERKGARRCVVEKQSASGRAGSKVSRKRAQRSKSGSATGR